MQGTLLTRITIPNYIRRVRLSEAQRVKHYEWDGTTIKSKGKKLLLKYINPIYKEAIIRNDGNILIEYLIPKYVIIGFKGDKLWCQRFTDCNELVFANKYTEKQLAKPTKYILCEEKFLGQYTKVVANETQAGKPKYHIINGQAFYNQTLNPFARIKVMEEIKEMYAKKLRTVPKEKLDVFRNKLNSSLPIQVVMEIQDTPKSQFDNSKDELGRRWDVGNRAEPYMKGFLDFIVNGTEDIEPLIKDDDRLHISSGNNSYFTPIFQGNTPKLIFHFYHDDRKIWETINS